MSLAGALEEYLNDPNFEQNRIEYKTNKEAAERNEKLGIKASKPPEKCKLFKNWTVLPCLVCDSPIAAACRSHIPINRTIFVIETSERSSND